MSLIENKSNSELDERIVKAIAIASSELLVKASLGSVASNMTFDPDARDGDGDGMVQDGSPFERPAVITAITNASERVAKLLAKATRVTQQGRQREYQRRYSGMSAKDIARTAVPDSMEAWTGLVYEKMRIEKPELPALSGNLTPSQVKEVVRAIEDYIKDDLVWMLSVDDAKTFQRLLTTDRAKAFRFLMDDVFDFSPQAVAKNRELVEHSLSTNPQFRELVDRYGLPPIMKYGSKMDSAHMASGAYMHDSGIILSKIRAPRSKGRLEPLVRGLSKWFMDGQFPNDVGNKKTKRWTVGVTPQELLIHEYGHYLSAILKDDLTGMDRDQRTRRWQAWRFSAGRFWEETFREMGHPEWFDKYKVDEGGKRKADIPDDIPHVLTAYGESTPQEAFAEAISAIFSHDGKNEDLVNPALKELINELLELPQGKSPRESLTPQRTRREILPDGFASRGSVNAINNERDERFGELTDPYELTAEWLGTLDGNDPVGSMVRRIRGWMDRPRVWDRLNETEKKRMRENLNIRRATEQEAALILQTLMNNPAFAEMIRRHGIANMYFSERDLKLVRNDGTEFDVRGAAMGSFTPDDSTDGQYWPPRIVMDLVGDSDERDTPDVPTTPIEQTKLREWRTQKIPANVTRSHVSNSDQAVIRHEGGHSIHDMLWEKVHRGEIKGRRATLIRAYASSTWEEFYTVLGRPDLWEEHQRALRATHSSGPGSKVPSPEIQQIDSAYAWSNPREMFAEGFTAYTSSNPDQRALMNDTLIEHLQAILGDADSELSTPPTAPEIRDLDEPEAERWAAFASSGISSYSDVRRTRMEQGKGRFSRSELFRNTTTDQKIDLAVPDNENDYALMAWDQIFERMGLTYEEISKIDLSDPYNPKVPRRYKAALESLESYANIIKRDLPDLDPKNVQTNRDALRATLDAFPRMREAAERYGLPPLGTMSRDTRVRSAQELILRRAAAEFWSSRGEFNGRKEIMDALPAFMEYAKNPNQKWEDFLNLDEVAGFRDLLQEFENDGKLQVVVDSIGGGYSPLSEILILPESMGELFRGGKRVDLTYAPEAGSWGMTDGSYEGILLHEYGHHVHRRLIERAKKGDQDARRLIKEHATMFSSVDDHMQTEYGRTIPEEFAAEAFAAIMSGSRDAEELLSPDARRWAREAAGFPEKDPVFAGRTGLPKTYDEMLTDRFGQTWIRTRDGMLEAIDEAKAERSRDGVPDVLETFADARRRTGLKPFDNVEFEHDGRNFVMRQVGDTFEIDINGRTVASASVVEGRDGLPEIPNVDVLPGYDGIAPDKDLHAMVVDHAQKRYPSARAPQRARKADVVTDGFSSVGPEHHDARQIDGTPGTPEYVENLVTELEAAKASGKKVFFDYNGVTREVEITEIVKGKNGHWYLKGRDAIRNNEEREFRLDRVSMPKIVKNPETGKDEVAKKPGKPPRKPVPVFTGKAAEIFEGAESWEDVATRLGKGRYVFFDFETTGIEEDEFGNMLHPGTPVQIGLVEIIDGKVTRRWSTHVNPGRPMSIDPKTGRSWSADNLKYKDPVTGEVKNLTDEWLSGQKPLKEALEEMLEFIGPIEDTILGGQNHPYDDDVMKRALAFAGLDESRWNPAGFIDSQALAQSLLDKDSDDYPRDPKKGYKTVSLGPLAKFLGWDMGDGWHSADADSEASYEAFIRLVRRAADHENSGKPVRRDLFAPGGGEKEYAERIAGYENEKRGWDWKVKKYKAAQAEKTPGEDGFASRGSADAPVRRASNPASWKDMTPEERDAATQASAQTAIDYLNALSDAGIDIGALRDLDRAELDAILKDLVPGGEARVSDYVTGDGKALIEVSNATMGQVFMSLGFHVQVISDDPNEHHLLENGINDMQKALQDYVKAVAKDPDALLRDRVFRDWATKQGINLDELSDKKLEKAAKKFAEQFEINLCLYYKAGSNMLCGSNIGIEREEMPQLGGRMKGDDTLAAKAIKAGLMAAKEFKLDEEKLNSLDPAKQDELRKLAKNPARVAELARQKDPLVNELFDILNWNDTEANVEPIADKAAEALGIVIDAPRFVDPATMLGAQNQLQGSKVENMADGAVEAVLAAIPVLEARLGRKPTNRELSDYLANEVKHGLFQPTLTAGLPGGQIYMLDGHHRWSGLLMANKKLEAMGIDVRVELNIKNYQTDIRSGLELGRAIQVAMGVKDAKLAGEDPFKFDPDIPELTPEEFDAAVAGILDPAKLVERLREVRKGGKFRETEGFDVPGGQQGRLRPRKRPIGEVVDEVTGRTITLEPQSRVKGVKGKRRGYRAAGSGSGWQSVEDHIKLETERGNPLFDTYKEYVDKGYEVSWVTHTPGEAGRYVVSAGDVEAWQAGEIQVNPEDIDDVSLAGATLVGTDDEGGFLYVRKKRTPRIEETVRRLEAEEEVLDGFASTGDEPVADDSPSDRLIEAIRKHGNTSREQQGTISRKIFDEVEERQKNGTMPENDEEANELAERMFRRAVGRRGKYVWYDKNIHQALVDYLKIEAGLGENEPSLPGEGEGFASRGKRIGRRDIVPDDWNRRVGDQVGKPQKEWSNVDPETGIPIPGNPIYKETIRIAPSGMVGRRTYKFEVDEEGYVSVYDKKNTLVGSLRLDRGFTREGGRRRQRDDRHHVEYVHVDERHRRRGLATYMAEIAEHVYGGRIEHSQILSTTGKKWRNADVKRRGTPALPDPFGEEDGSVRVPVDQVGFASRGNYKPISLPGEESFLDTTARRMGLTGSNLPDVDYEMNALTARIGAKIAGGEASLAERLGITPEQLRDRLQELAGEINQFVDNFVNDKEVRRNVKLGYKILSTAALLFGAKGMKEFLSMINPSLDGGADRSTGSSNNLLSIVDSLLSAGIHEALIAYGANFANLIATEFAAMRLVTRQKAKEMIADIRARIEGTGQNIGVMSREMWNRLRGAWAKTRALAPIGVPSDAKQWIVSGASPMWAELSWADYQAKSRITQRLQPSDTRRWGQIASKVGPSPELIDIATYRAGLGYGTKRVKSRDVVRVYL